MVRKKGELTASAQDVNSYKLDIPIDSLGINYYGDFNIITGASSLANGRYFKVGEVEVMVGVDKMSNIIFYSSRDSNFLINNFRYLSNEQNYIDSIKKNCKLRYEKGWAAFIPIGEDWNLAFRFEDAEKDPISKRYVLKNEAKPTFVFKRSIKLDGNSKLRSKVRGAPVNN